MDDDRLLSIGQLARLSGLTAKALRHYDRVGLLTPAEVDPDTGFRFYDRDQVPIARRIARLRAVDLPLDGVRSYLAGDTDVLLRHRSRLESRTPGSAATCTNCSTSSPTEWTDR